MGRFIIIILQQAFLISTYDHRSTRLVFRLTFLVSQLVAESRSITFWLFLNSKNDPFPGSWFDPFPRSSQLVFSIGENFRILSFFTAFEKMNKTKQPSNNHISSKLIYLHGFKSHSAEDRLNLICNSFLVSCCQHFRSQCVNVQCFLSAPLLIFVCREICFKTIMKIKLNKKINQTKKQNKQTQNQNPNPLPFTGPIIQDRVHFWMTAL